MDTSAIDNIEGNGDGKISVAELGELLSSVGLELKESQLEWIVAKIDKDADGMVDPEELKTLIQAVRIVFSKVMKMFNQYNNDEIRAAFVENDTDGTGTISSAELPNVLRSLDDSIDDDSVSEIIDDADSNGDGVIDYNEFLRWKSE